MAGPGGAACGFLDIEGTKRLVCLAEQGIVDVQYRRPLPHDAPNGARYPKAITTTELASRLDEQGFCVTMRCIQRALSHLKPDLNEAYRTSLGDRNPLLQ